MTRTAKATATAMTAALRDSGLEASASGDPLRVVLHLGELGYLTLDQYSDGEVEFEHHLRRRIGYVNRILCSAGIVNTHWELIR